MHPRPDRLSADALVTRARRREAGASSARSLVLTLLGEFVRPQGDPVWTGAVLEAMATLDVEERAARKALSRIATDGVIEPDRVGRKTRWSLTECGRQLLNRGTERMSDFMRDPGPWDGRWLIIVVTIPEAERRTRQRLRSRLAGLGAGSPAPGLWVHPRTSMEGAVENVIDELGVRVNTVSWTGTSSSIGDYQDVARKAWPLDSLAEHYEEFLADFGQRAPHTDRECFAAQIALVEAWRRFPLIDPGLPAELLGTDWPGPWAAALFRARHGVWDEQARQHWDDITARNA